MEMYQDGAICKRDELGRNPLDMEDDDCPLGYLKCSGNCEYYEE